MELFFPHEIVFSNKEKILVGDVALSLIANEQIVHIVGKVLELCFDGLTVEKVNVEFRSASVNSPLKEALAAGILLTYQDDLKREVPKMIEAITGRHIDPNYTTIVTVVFLVIVIYGIEKAWDIFKNSNKEKTKEAIPQSIYNNYGTLIQNAGDLLQIPPAELDRAVRMATPPKQEKALARSVLSFIQPAKRERGASIAGAGMIIDAATIEDAPSPLDIALDSEDDETQNPFERREVIIHATDIDHNASGWAGHIPGVWEKRLRMKLFPAISPGQLFGKEKITADIIVVAKRDSEGHYVPYLFHVVRVYD